MRLVRPELQIQIVRWIGIEAVLVKPPDWDGKTKLPLVVYVHGGPTGRGKMRSTLGRSCWRRGLQC